MRKLLIPGLFLLTLSAGYLSAADEASAPGPTLVLPQVTLDIQDLSTENVQAMLPPAGQSTVTQKAVPLPGSPAFSVSEPSRQIFVEGSDPLGGGEAAQRPLATQATLGLGSQNRVVARLNVATVGGSTHSNLSFVHETADGISGKDPGSGYDTRNDSIAGSLSGRLGPLDGGFRGGYAEQALGLQQQSPSYISRLDRNLDGTAGLSAQPLDWLSVDGNVSGTTDALILAAGTPTGGPAQSSEYKGTGHLGATARSGIFSAGLSGDYTYRTASMLIGGTEQLQRIRTGLSLGLDFPGSVLLEGAISWFGNTEGLSLLPFSLHLTGATLSVFTFDLSFGYRVVPYDEVDIYALNPYIIPLSLVDDRGWFGDAAVQLAVFGDVSLKAGATIMKSDAMPTAPSLTGSGTGLYGVTQQSALRLTGDTSIRWNAAPGVTLDARWKREFIDRPSFAPLDEITGEAIAMETTGAYGGQLAVTMLTGSGFSWLPVVDVGGFVRLSDAAQLRLDLYDLLWTLMNGPRYGPSLSPYVEPGFRAVASIRLSF